MSDIYTFIFIVIDVKHYVVVVSLCSIFNCEKTKQTRIFENKEIDTNKLFLFTM
jgi:hypothetical protein